MLFQNDEIHNLLPQDGVVHYWPALFTGANADDYFQRLLNDVHWRADEARMYGKHIVTRRQFAWYADHPYEYVYSGLARRAMRWIPLVSELKALVEATTGQPYQSCLLNFYPDGESGMAWHQDDEAELRPNGSIASLSFGARRKFSLKHIHTNEKRDMWLDHGDLLEMAGLTQLFWRHCVPKSKRVTESRVNLTFRQMADHGSYIHSEW